MNGFGVPVKDHNVMPTSQETLGHVAAHLSQPNHSQLHLPASIDSY
jgi:hypothetical protein